MAVNYEPHTLITWGGNLGDPTEGQSWSFGMRVDITSEDWLDASVGNPTVGPDSAAAWLANFQDSWDPSHFANSMYLTSCKVAIIGNDGHYVAPPWVAEGDLGTPYGTGATHMPFQIAMVGTLRHVGLGHGNWGRIYYPAPTALPAGDGLIDAGLRVTLAGLHNDFVAAVNDTADGVKGGASVGIYSRTAGTRKTVEQTALGRVYDTQRRRRDQLVESLVYLPLP